MPIEPKTRDARDDLNHLIGETDAQVWAREFVKLMTSLSPADRSNFVTDEGVMIGWFANAIMAGYDQREREERAGLEPNPGAPVRRLGGDHSADIIEWQPGDLTTADMERVLTDVLADLWRDTYRRDTAAADLSRRLDFRRKVESAIYAATGQEYWLTRSYANRGNP